MACWIVLFATCAHNTTFVPESPAPDGATIHQLLNAPVPPKQTLKDLQQFSIRLDPYALMEGQPTTVVCDVPPAQVRDGATIVLGIRDVAVSGQPLESRETRFHIEHVPCGTWTAICEIPRMHVTQDILVHGDCNGSK